MRPRSPCRRRIRRWGSDSLPSRWPISRSNRRDFVAVSHPDSRRNAGDQPQQFLQRRPQQRSFSARNFLPFRFGGSRAQSTDWLLDGNDNNELTAGGIAILPSIDAIQNSSSNLQLLGRIWHARGSNGAGHHEARHEPTSRIVVRVLPQHETRCAQLLRFQQRTVQLETSSVARWVHDQEGQDLLLPRLSGEEATARHPVHGLDSDACHDDGWTTRTIRLAIPSILWRTHSIIPTRRTRPSRQQCSDEDSCTLPVLHGDRTPRNFALGWESAAHNGRLRNPAGPFLPH